MIPNPLDRYRLAKARQHEVWNDAAQDRQAKETAMERPQQTAHPSARAGSFWGALTFWLKRLRKAPPAPTTVHARSCPGSAASAHTHPSGQFIGPGHPHGATQAGHSWSHAHGTPGRVG